MTPASDSVIVKAKQAAACEAVKYVQDGMIVGLGTGSTASLAIRLLAGRVKNGLNVTGIPTSVATAEIAIRSGIKLEPNLVRADLTIDGADEVDKQGRLLKGGGGALTREKIVAANTALQIIIIDESKSVDALGKFPVAVEVLPFGWQATLTKLEGLGCTAHLRGVHSSPFFTDNKNYIVDCEFGRIEEATVLSSEINDLPGVVENGIFPSCLTGLVVVGKFNGEVEVLSIKKKVGVSGKT